MNEIIAQILKQIMATKGLNAAELARRSGVSMASLSRLLAGKTAPSFETMHRLAGALEVDIALFTGATAAKSNPEYDMVQAVYALEHTENTPTQAAKLLEQAARGSWVATVGDGYADPATPQVQVLSARAAGTRRIEVVLGYPHTLIEAGSLVGVLSVVASALTGTGAKLLDLAIPLALMRTFNGPSFGVRGLRDVFNKHGRPLLAATVRPMQGLSGRMYGQLVHEALSGGCDFTADPTLLHNTPNLSWRDRARFCGEAAQSASRETNEFKAHMLNITAATQAEMEERIAFVRDIDMTMVMVDAAAVGWVGMQSLATFCAKQDMALAAMGGRALFGDMVSEQLQAKLLRLLGADVVSTASPLRGNLANRRYVQGVLAALREPFTAEMPEGGQYLPQSFGGLPGAFPAVGGGHNPWHFARLLDAVGNHTIVQCGGSVFGHPQGAHSGAMACRTAMEALVQARDEGQNLAVEGRAVLQKAAKYSPELRVALEHFQEGNFLFGLVQSTPRPTGASVLPSSGNPSPNVAPTNVLTPFRKPESPSENDED
jgi:ribulose-bisphosphate carboxylase large chain